MVKPRWRTVATDLACLIAGSVLYAISVVVFSAPNRGDAKYVLVVAAPVAATNTALPRRICRVSAGGGREVVA